MRILILIGRQLCTAPRPQKEALALARAGHDVTVMGFWLDPALAERDRALLANAPYRFIPLVEVPRDRWRHGMLRLRSRLSRELFSRAAIFSPDLLGFLPTLMLSEARRFRADLTICHSEASLWVGEKLLAQGRRVGIDMEDWFSRDLPEQARRQRPVARLEHLEGTLLRRASYRLATSRAMADALAAHFSVPPPAVVYNVFPFTERATLDGLFKDRQDRERPSLHWFSQSIGPGRGLEALFQALALTGDHAPQVHIRGHLLPAYEGWLREQLAKAPAVPVFIHPTVPNAELPSRIAEHDIGMALEEAAIVNRDVSITNKIFQYLQAGLAIVATPTAGQREVFSHNPAIGRLLPDDSPASIAEAIRSLMASREQLARAKEASLQAARDRFSWEHQEPVLLAEAERALR
jgi:glycosyltransferase involved in cell wall biosynthesis